MNPSVQVLNYNGTVGIFAPLATEAPQEIAAFNRLFNINITVNPDGTIPSAKAVTDKV